MISNFSKFSIFFYCCVALVSCSTIDAVDDTSGHFLVNVFDCSVPIPDSFILDTNNKVGFFFRHRDFFATSVNQNPDQSRNEIWSSINIEDIVDGMSIERRVDRFSDAFELIEIRRVDELRLLEVVLRGEGDHFVITDGVTEMTFAGPHISIEYLDGILVKCGG